MKWLVTIVLTLALFLAGAYINALRNHQFAWGLVAAGLLSLIVFVVLVEIIRRYFPKIDLVVFWRPLSFFLRRALVMLAALWVIYNLLSFECQLMLQGYFPNRCFG